ncbi:MAG: hypothetical protein QW123_02240 [Desulfurococcaceae archaeon]
MTCFVDQEDSYCEVCGEKLGKYRCRMCSRVVCEDHYEASNDMCVVCRDLLCKICKSYLSIGVCKYCGRLGCEMCLIQATPVEYICVECYRKIHGCSERAEYENR